MKIGKNNGKFGLRSRGIKVFKDFKDLKDLIIAAPARENQKFF